MSKKQQSRMGEYYTKMKYFGFVYKFSKAALLLTVLILWGIIPYVTEEGSTQSSVNNATVNSSASGPNNKSDVKPGEKISWRKSADTTQEVNRLNGTFIETINKNQKFAGNLQLPKGWAAEYSTDPLGTPPQARTYQTYNSSPGAYTEQELAAMNFLRIDTAATESLKPSVEAPILQPLEPKKLPHADEGYIASTPVLYNDKVFFVFRGVWSGPDKKNLDCFDLITYQRCDGFPTYAAASSGAMPNNQTPLGSGTSDLSTPYNFEIILDEDLTRNEGWMYFPAQNGDDYGVICVNLNTLTNCGFTVLGTASPPPPPPATPRNALNPTVLAGFTQYGDKIYGHANDSDEVHQTMLCYDIRLHEACSGYDEDTLSLSTPLYLIQYHQNSYDTPGTHVIHENKMYWNVNYSAGNTRVTDLFAPASTQRKFGTRVFCFNVVTQENCSGWTPPAIYTSDLVEYILQTLRVRPYNIFLWQEPDESIDNVCLHIGLGAETLDPQTRCFDIETGGNPSPSKSQISPSGWLSTPWTYAPNDNTITDENGDRKTYFPVYKTGGNTNLTAVNKYLPPTKGGTMCYNWTTQKPCAWFGDRFSGATFDDEGEVESRFMGHKGIRYWHEINLGQGGDIGYVYDGSCMWGMGHAGYVWSFDPMSGDTPCRVARVKNKVSIEQSEYYCDGVNRILNWDKARLTRARLFDFENLNIKISDANDENILIEEDIKETQKEVLDLGIAYSQHQELRIDMLARLYNETPWGNGNTPYVSLISNSASAQYCYDTEVPSANCDVASVNTISQARLELETDTLVRNNTKNFNVTQDADKQCFQDLKASLSANKTIVRENETITYTLDVTNKANVDPQRRGDIAGATYRVTIPSGFSYVSSSGGSVQNGQVVWTNRSIAASETKSPTVTFRANPATVSQADTDKGFKWPFMGEAHAAEQQKNVTVFATVQYDGDVFEGDNDAQNQGVVLIQEIPDDAPPGPTDPTVDEPPVWPTDPGGGQQTDSDQGLAFGSIEDDEQPTSGDTGAIAAREEYTPQPLQRVVPEPVKEQVELFFNTLYGIVTPIPKGVAIAIPFIAITFLAVFAVVYFLLIIKEGENKRQLRILKKRFEQTESARKDYINIVSHYLNTPISTMKLTLESLKNSTKVPKTMLEKANGSIAKIVKDTDQLIDQSNTKVKSKQTKQALDKTSNRRLINFNIIAIIVGVLILTILLNLVFIWAERFEVSATLIITQSLYFTLTFTLLITVYRSFTHTRYANAVIEQEFAYEQELAETQSRFIANASTVLNNDISELDQFTTNISSAPRSKPYIESINSLKEIVGRLMAINTLVTKQRHSSEVKEDIGEMIQGVVKAMQPEAEKKLIEMSMFIEPNLKTDIDREDIEIVTSSIIDNAIKFNEEGGSVEVIVKSKNEKFATITVKDTGAGIPKDKVDTIFAPFSRATGTLEFNYEGVGLDLYTVKLTVEHYGGTIRVESEEGKGTTVYIELPLL